MADNRLKCPKITWGTSFANTLSIGYPLDNYKSGSTPRDGSAWAQSPGGAEDAWIVGTDYTLEGDIRWIPQTNVATPAATGWDTASTGFRLFLEWARAKNAFRWFPDKDAVGYIESYLVEPLTGTPEPETDGTRSLHIVMRNSSSAYDGY